MPAARPKDAASLILVRRDRDGPRILMGRRAKGHDFVPDKWVFPGGKVERADYAGPLLRDLRPEVAAGLAASARLKRQHGPRFARALARAAIRETFEETGIVLGRRIEDGVEDGVDTGGEGGIVGDLGALSYVARAITPPSRPKRFDARFLLADVTGLPGLRPESSGELDEIGWFPLDACFALDIIAVTRAVLTVAGKHLEGRASDELPFWRWTPGNPRLAL